MIVEEGVTGVAPSFFIIFVPVKCPLGRRPNGHQWVPKSADDYERQD